MSLVLLVGPVAWRVAGRPRCRQCVIAPLTSWRDYIAFFVREVLEMDEVCCRGVFSVSRSARKRACIADFSVGRLGRVDKCFIDRGVLCTVLLCSHVAVYFCTVVVFVLDVGDVPASDRVGARGMRVCSKRDKKDNCVLEARRRPREVTLSP
ncbi:unnamed protein product, partial [Ectocarpus sp. 4 AP-2014]